MRSELCMNCFAVKGPYEVCPYCGYVEGSQPKKPHYLEPGTFLSNHILVGTVIGVGGFGITYQCFDTTLGVRVAVKEFYPAGLVNRASGEKRVGLLSGDKKEQYKTQLDRFLMEAQSVAKFGNAKDIVNVYDFFEENGTAYIVMEYIDGILLKDYLEKQGAVSVKTALSIVLPIIEAVKKIHSKGIIHQDISPDNIFIADNNTIKIFDFGAAQLNGSKEGMAAEKVIKVGYSAPEQYRNKSNHGFVTDVYSIGAILYQLLTGVKPIESTEREFKDELLSPKELDIKISSNMDKAVMEALAVKPELRIQGVVQLEDALLNKRIAEYPQVKLKRRKRKRNWMISLTAAVALTLVIGVGLYSTILKPQNLIFDSKIQKDTKVTIWVENDDQKRQIENMIQQAFGEGKDTSQQSLKIAEMQENTKASYYDVEVKSNMNKAMTEAKENDDLPNMFLADHVLDAKSYGLISLKDNVYEALNIKDYILEPNYGELFEEMTEMPTGVDTLVLYKCQFDYNKNNKVSDSEVEEKTISGSGTEEDLSVVELDDIFNSDGELYKSDDDEADFISPSVTSVEKEEINKVLLLKDFETMNNYLSGQGTLTEELQNSLVYIGDMNNVVRNKKYKISQNLDIDLYGSNVLAGIATRKKLKDAEETEEDRGANPLKRFVPCMVVNDGEMLLSFAECYAITETSSQDQQIACMRLLWVMMSEMGQEEKLAPGQTTCPIMKTQFDKFDQYNSGFEEMRILYNEQYPCQWIGKINVAKLE